MEKYPEMQEYFKENIPLISEAFKTYYPRQITREWFESNIGKVNHSFNPEMWEEITSKLFYDLLDRGGKRIRPLLTCLTHQALNGKSNEIHKFSIIPEIIHNATLMVDDIEDNSNTRRGDKCVHLKYGNAQTINNGNFNYFFPMLIVQNSNIPDSHKIKIYETIIQEMTELHLGQERDIDWANKNNYDVNIDEYLQMCEYKTGALLGISMKIGAILSNTNGKKINELEEIAYPIGIAFQIKDDILNLKPTEQWGKDSGEDITEGKLSYVVVYTLSNANKQDKEKLSSILRAKTSNKLEIDKAIAIMDEYDSFNEAEKYAKNLIVNAKEKVNEVFPDTKYKQIYLQLLDYMFDRQK
jgi:geranylgeranyl diphosphate synthase, type I